MALLGAVAAGAAGDIGGGEKLAAVRVKREVVGGAIGNAMYRVGFIRLPKGQFGASVKNLGMAGEGVRVEVAQGVKRTVALARDMQFYFLFTAGQVENEHRGFARAKGVAFGFLHAAGGESFAVRTKGEATDAANVGDEVVQACVQNFGIEFANGFPLANGPLTNATVEIAADQVFAVRRAGEAKDTLLMALELG